MLKTVDLLAKGLPCARLFGMEAEVEHSIPSDQFRYRLLLARLHAGDLTTREAAERCGLNYVSWSNWERGKRPRDLITVAEAVSEGLGIDRDWLLFGGPLAQEERRAGRILERRKRQPAGEHSSYYGTATGGTGAGAGRTIPPRAVRLAGLIDHSRVTRPPGRPDAATAPPRQRRTGRVDRRSA